MKTKYSKKQWSILLVYSVVNILSGFCFSLHGPFYPMIAESKGVTPSQYGIVFSVYSIFMFIASTLSAVIINRFNVVKVSLSGVVIIGTITIMFGFVDRLDNKILFLSVSIIIRIAEGLGSGLVRNAAVAIIACEFSENVEIAFATIQTFSSVGFLIGPVVGGALFELRGFYLPFVVVGTLLLCNALMIFFLPKNYPEKDEKSGKQIPKLLRQPSVILGIFYVLGSALNGAFIISILEPHIKSLSLSPVQVGSVFLCSGLVYSFSTLFWSFLCERYDNTFIMSSISALIVVCGLIVIGPAPYFPFALSLYTCILGLFIHGIGSGGEHMSGFSILNKGVCLAGFSQNIQTSGLVSMIYTSSSALGYFIGPVIGGYLFETLGFPWGSHIFMAYHLLLCLLMLIFNYLWRGNIDLHSKPKHLTSEVITGIYRSVE